MKLVLITDLHIGARNDNEAIAALQRKFYFDFLIPQMKKRKLKTVFCGGDFFDKRTHVSLKSMQFARELEQEFGKAGISFLTLVGNHDTLYRNTNSVNSLESFFSGSSVFKIFSEPTELPEYNMLAVPWINSENIVQATEAIGTSNARFCYGHFAIKGFEFHKGTVCDHGMDQTEFNRFEQVLSGHFHTQSMLGNIRYIGSPYEMSWSDYNDPRGFHLFDTGSGELEFVPFTESLFFTAEYVGDKVFYTPYQPDSFEQKFVKVVVKEKTTQFDFDLFIKGIQVQNPADLSILEMKYDINTKISMDEEDAKRHIKGNLDVIQSYVNGMTDVPPETRSSVLNCMVELFNEAVG